MNRHEADIITMARLYECRTAARFIFRDAYDATIAPYRDALVLVMGRETLMPLQAVLRLAPSPEHAVPLMLLFAAAIDLMEARHLVPAGATAPETHPAGSAPRGCA